jgi:hypothetical protein
MNLLSVEKIAGWLTFLVKKNAKTGEETSELHIHTDIVIEPITL